MAIAVVACGSRTELDARSEAGVPGAGDGVSCAASPIQCVRGATDDPCDAPAFDAPFCDGLTNAWKCGQGAWPYRRAGDSSVCLPFHGPASPIRRLSGSLTRVPTNDGRCIWIAEELETAERNFRNVALVPERTAPFGTCPTDAPFLGGVPHSVVVMPGVDDPTVIVQVTGAYRIGGMTRVLYRLFRADPGAVFGLQELGTSLGRWDDVTEQIVVGGPSVLRFANDLDLGDASFVRGEQAFIWGCPRSMSTARGCVLGRADSADVVMLFLGAGQWSVTAHASAAASLFTSGPWISSVTSVGANLLHVYSTDFGTSLDTHVASAPEGPWSDGPSLGPCDLPGDPKAYCAGPVVHADLNDPSRPAEIAITYGVGTTASPPPPSNAETYWSRLVRLTTR